MIITGSEHCEHACSFVCGIIAADIEDLKFQFSIHISNFELTGDPFKLIKLYNLCSLL